MGSFFHAENGAAREGPRRCWLIAATFDNLKSLGSKCEHPRGTHQSIAGVIDERGAFLSRATATYPAKLCDALASKIAPLLSSGQRVQNLHSAEAILSIKQLNDLPNARNDGGGLPSHADWSQFNASQDFLGTLRKNG